MRKAAGIILIVSAIVLVVGVIIEVINYHFRTAHMWLLIEELPYAIVYGGLLVAGGVYCFKRRYWGLCLVSAVVPLSLWITPVARWLVTVVAEGSLEGGLSFFWHLCVVVLGTLVSTIFIVSRKKEWQEFSDSVDGEVFLDG